MIWYKPVRYFHIPIFECTIMYFLTFLSCSSGRHVCSLCIISKLNNSSCNNLISKCAHQSEAVPVVIYRSIAFSDVYLFPWTWCINVCSIRWWTYYNGIHLSHTAKALSLISSPRLFNAASSGQFCLVQPVHNKVMRFMQMYAKWLKWSWIYHMDGELVDYMNASQYHHRWENVPWVKETEITFISA